MKHVLKLSLLVTMYFFCTNISSADEAVETAKIDSLIQEFLQNHADGDYEAWIDKWADDNEISIFQTGTNGLNILQGLDLKNVMQNHLAVRKKEIKNSDSKLELKTSHVFIKVYSETAWAKFKITWTLTSSNNAPTIWETFENYFFVKQGNEWKITTISASNLNI